MRRPSWLALAVLVAGCAFASARPSAPSPPTQWLTDGAGLLRPETRQVLNERLGGYERSTGHQVLVWIGERTGGAPLEDFAVDAFKAWRVGRKGLDDGLVLFIFPADRAARIEVGYGLEARVPDVTASRLLREELFPGLKAGQPDAAVTKTVEGILARLEGTAPPQPAATVAPPAASPSQLERPLVPSGWRLVGLLVVALMVIGLFLMNPALALQLLWVIGGGAGRGRRGGGGGGGWGFSGGGGRSGGGGASGHW